MGDVDPIVEEVRRIRDAHAAKFDYDPVAIFRDIKEREKTSGRTYVSFAEENSDENASAVSAIVPATANNSCDPSVPAAKI